MHMLRKVAKLLTSESRENRIGSSHFFRVNINQFVTILRLSSFPCQMWVVPLERYYARGKLSLLGKFSMRCGPELKTLCSAEIFQKRS